MRDGLVVLTSMRAERPTTNPYIVQLNRLLAERLELRPFSWRAALTGRYDVFHIHWPDAFVRRSSAWRTALACLALAGLLVRIRVTRRVLVRTAHNVTPHERQAPLVRAVLAWCDAWTTQWIRLNDLTPVPAGARAVTILHGSYTDWFAHLPVPERVGGNLLYFGLVRPYKGVGELVAAFRATSDPALSLTIAGSPADAAAAQVVEAEAAGDDRITLDLRHVPDEELVAAVGRATLVVLPYKAMHNSGAALLALSLGRPVLVPANDVTRALRDEVGGDWVLLFEGTLDAAALERAAVEAAELRGLPDLSRRSWPAIADQHVEAFRSAVASRARRRPRRAAL